MLQKGLVLVTGPTGSGKSTTLAAVVDHANKMRKDNIITIEDSVEFAHTNQNCIISPARWGRDTRSFAAASAAPCARTRTSSSSARCATSRPSSSPSRRVDRAPGLRHPAHPERLQRRWTGSLTSFPRTRQPQIRGDPGRYLKAVVAQTLFKRVGRKGPLRRARNPDCHVGRFKPDQGRQTYQLPGVIQTGKKYGMITWNDSNHGPLEALDLARGGLRQGRGQAEIPAILA